MNKRELIEALEQFDDEQKVFFLYDGFICPEINRVYESMTGRIICTTLYDHIGSGGEIEPKDPQIRQDIDDYWEQLI